MVSKPSIATFDSTHELDGAVNRRVDVDEGFSVAGHMVHRPVVEVLQ
jgi:hypothetical protein